MNVCLYVSACGVCVRCVFVLLVWCGCVCGACVFVLSVCVCEVVCGVMCDVCECV